MSEPPSLVTFTNFTFQIGNVPEVPGDTERAASGFAVRSNLATTDAVRSYKILATVSLHTSVMTAFCASARHRKYPKNNKEKSSR